MPRTRPSELVCARCGISVHEHASGYRHALGGRTGAIPSRLKHYPVPVARTTYQRAFSIDTPLLDARELLAVFRQLDDTYQAYGALTPNQRTVYRMIRDGHPYRLRGQHPRRVIDALEKSGLIEIRDEDQLGWESGHDKPESRALYAVAVRIAR